MNANNDDESGNGILNCQMPFHEIKSDETTSQCNTVHCSTANENFQAGESIKLHPPVHINIYVSHVAAILQVDQQSSPQRVLFSLFLDEKKEMNIKLHPPDKRSYVRYPSQRLVWTRYQGWFPTSRVQREAFVVAPWEVDKAINHAEVCIGMNNAYCIVGKWNHDDEINNPSTRAFKPLGHGKNNIPGSLHLAMKVDGATQRYWTFRCTLSLTITESLSKASLATRTRQAMHIDGVPECLWDNFRRHTIPIEETERKGVVTKCTIRNNLAIEMLRNITTNYYARFDTLPRFHLLKGYFGFGIQGAGRICRMAGPKLLRRTGPCPAFASYHLQNHDTVGAVIRLPDQPTKEYHSKKPGVDIIYHPARRQLTVRLRYIVEGVGVKEIRQQLLGVQPLSAMPNIEEDGHSAAEVVPNFTQFQYQGTLFLVVAISADGKEGVCQVEETTNNNFIVGEQVNFGMDLVQQAVAQYNAMDGNGDDDDNNDNDSSELTTDDDDNSN
jgi:hypothetical protein